MEVRSVAEEEPNATYDSFPQKNAYTANFADEFSKAMDLLKP